MIGLGPAYQALQRNSGAIQFSFESGQLPAALSFARNSAGTRHDGSGELVDMAADAPRFDHGATGGSQTALLYEAASANVALYASSPGDNNGWSESATQNGLSITRIATGTLGDLAYADYRIQGTASANFTDKFYLSTPSRVAASAGQTFTGSCYVQVIGGSTANVGKFTASVIEETGSAGYLGQSNSDWTIDYPTLTRISATRTLSDPTAGNVRLAMLLSSLTVDGEIDITLRLAGPQLEEASSMSSFIQVPGATPGQREADHLFLPAYSGDREITVTFSDASTEGLAYSSLVDSELPRFAKTEITGLQVAPL